MIQRDRKNDAQINDQIEHANKLYTLTSQQNSNVKAMKILGQQQLKIIWSEIMSAGWAHNWTNIENSQMLTIKMVWTPLKNGKRKATRGHDK